MTSLAYQLNLNIYKIEFKNPATLDIVKNTLDATLEEIESKAYWHSARDVINTIMNSLTSEANFESLLLVLNQFDGPESDIARLLASDLNTLIVILHDENLSQYEIAVKYFSSMFYCIDMYHQRQFIISIQPILQWFFKYF